MTFLIHPTGARLAMVFADGKWTYRNVWEDNCASGAGKAQAVETGEFPLPQPPQNPITLLVGRGHHEHTGACTANADIELKLQRTGD